MKKILFLFLGLSLIFSCSNGSIVENDVLTLKRGEDEIIKKYKELVHSVEFGEYRAMQRKFSDKLSLSEEESHPVFKDKEEMFNWISENLSNTGFLSISEAMDDYNEIASKYLNVMESNSSLFMQISYELSNGRDDSLFLIDLEVPIYDYEEPIIVEPNNCGYECINDAVDCGRDADKAYAAATAISAGLWASGSTIAGFSVLAIASINHRSAQRACARTFNACYRACGY